MEPINAPVTLSATQQLRVIDDVGTKCDCPVRKQRRARVWL